MVDRLTDPIDKAAKLNFAGFEFGLAELFGDGEGLDSRQPYDADTPGAWRGSDGGDSVR